MQSPNQTRMHFLQQLILEEVIIRREANLKAFRHGLDVLEITTLLEEYPHLLKPLFIEKHPLAASQFKSLIDSEQRSDPVQGRAYDLLIHGCSGRNKPGEEPIC